MGTGDEWLGMPWSPAASKGQLLILMSCLPAVYVAEARPAAVPEEALARWRVGAVRLVMGAGRVAVVFIGEVGKYVD
ncbi:hypothetical protein RC55_18805 [Herbaspirillum seropedicae]|nr:hypothetical protein ACP92_06650 [Herbaspirillum seropedicae]NQE31260.1 hypothetical protein [Herbaspirillum seropedicae]